MKKSFIFVILSLVLLVLVSMVGIKTFKNSSYIIDNYTLHYYYESNYRYDVTTIKSKIIVNKNQMDICSVAPCPEEIVDSKNIDLNEEYVNFFKNVFNDGTNEKTVTKNDLSSDDYKTLKKILNIK